MKFTLEGGPRNVIRSYSSESIRIGEQTVHSSCIVTADVLIRDWAPQSLEELTSSHLEPVFALRPELVLLGTGARQCFPPAAVQAAFSERGVGIEAMDLGAACRTFNILLQEERRVAAMLFLK